jgi:glutathione S-transferase
MLELFHNAGSTSFVAHATLEEAGAEYRLIQVNPRDRSDPSEFATVNPLRLIPALRHGDVNVYEAAAVMLYVADLYPDSGLAPATSDPLRGPYYRWLVWCSNTFHPTYEGLFVPQHVTTDEDGHDAVRARYREKLVEASAYIERELAGRPWLLGDRFSAPDLYVYMLTAWANYFDDLEVGGPNLRAHYARVGERPAVVRTREQENLDEGLLRR